MRIEPLTTVEALNNYLGRMVRSLGLIIFSPILYSTRLIFSQNLYIKFFFWLSYIGCKTVV